MTRTLEKFELCMIGSFFCTVLDLLFGKIDYSFIFLLICMVLDFLTGMMAGAIEHKLSSEICTQGLFKKLMVFVYLIVAHHLDVLLGVNYIRVAVCYLYATGEVLSIIENGTRIGVPVPDPIKKALEILNGGKENEH